MLDINKLVRSNLLKFMPYQSARKIGGLGHIFLNANELPIDISLGSTHQALNRYPEPQPKNIIYNYAKYAQVDSNQILVTRGADEAIDLLIKTFCESGKDSIVLCPPTYDMYQITAQIYNVKYFAITLNKTWSLNLKKIERNLETTKIIFICRPNNPTGHIIHKDVILNLLKLVNNKNILIVIDEAYIEFCIHQTLVPLMLEYPNLVILRTLSKAFGLAGLRCGFIIANHIVINFLNKVIAPYPIPKPVIDIVSLALSSNNVQKMQDRVLQINKNRNQLIVKLREVNIIRYIFPSEANYILIRFRLSEKVFTMLSSQGIIIRNQNHKIHLKGCLRVSIGSQYECLQFINELKKISNNIK